MNECNKPSVNRDRRGLDLWHDHHAAAPELLASFQVRNIIVQLARKIKTRETSRAIIQSNAPNPDVQTHEKYRLV